MKLPVLSIEGKELRSLDVDESVFGIEPNQAVLHQAFVAGRNNQRWGTANTKTRGMAQGSTRKIRRQKYSGRSRQGSIRAPHHVGGGVAFGPHQRDYSEALPKKMRRLAIRSALSGKAAEGQLVIVDEMWFPKPKTKEMARVLRNVGIERSALIVTGQPDRTLLNSARNLMKTKVLPAAYLNVVDMMNHQKLLMTEEAVRVAEGLWGSRAGVTPAKAEAMPKRRSAAKAVAEAPSLEVVEDNAQEAVAAPKPRARKAAAPKAEVETAAKPKVRAPRKVVAKAEASTEEKKPAAARRKASPKPVAAESTAEAPKPRRRAKKTDEGEG